MAREMLLAGVKPEELQPTPSLQTPQTPKGKWENFWYHYKWVFWGVLFGIAALVFIIIQSAAVRKPDYTVLYVTESAAFDGDLALLEGTLAAYGRDLNEDGKVDVQIVNVYTGKFPGDSTNVQVLQAHLFSGDVMFFMWEPKQYDKMIENLQAASGEDFQFLAIPATAHSGLREDGVWNWVNDPRRQEGLLARFPEHLYFGVRNTSGTAGKSRELGQQCMELLENFMANSPTAVPTE